MLNFFFNDAKWYFISKFYQGISFILTLKIYTYFLSTSIFGEFSVINVTVLIFVAFSTSWLSSTLVRLSHIHKEDDFLYSLYWLLLYTICFGGLILFLFLITFKQIFGEISIGLVVLIIGNYLTTCIFNFSIILFTVQRKVLSYALFIFLQTSLSLVMVLLFFNLLSNKVEYIFLSILISNLFCLSLLFKNNYVSILNKKLNKNYLKAIYTYGIPVIFIQLFVSLTMYSDQLILKYFNFQEELGVYAANYTLVDKSINILGSVFITTFQPILFKLWENEGPKIAYKFFNRIVKIYLIVAAVICICLYFFYGYFSSFFISSNFRMGSYFIFILIGSLLLGLSNIFSEILTTNQKTKTIAYVYFAAFLVSIISNFLLVPKMGMKGTAIVNIFAYGVLFIGMFFTAKKYFSLKN